VTQPSETAVLIVGAGPTGLLLTAELERRKVPCHLIDARRAPMHWDRATVVHPRSLQIFESLGLVDQFLAAGCKQRIIKIYSAGKLLGQLDLATCGSLYGFNLGVSEEVTESILTKYLHQHGGEVYRASRLTGLAQHAGGAIARIERDGHTYDFEATWVVGCDGIHSLTRELSGIAFHGHEIARAWAVFDATVKNWNDTHEGNFCFLETLPVIFTALPGNRFRVYLRPSSEESNLVADATRILQQYIPHASFVDVENPTRFHCHTKVAAKFRDRAVFLAGDAAHLCSPAEGHGMNCGLQDAFNLAWKLALVHHGTADPRLLDSYEAERRPVADRITQSGDATEQVQATIDPVARAARDQKIKSTLADAKSRHHEVVAEAELCVDYSASPIVAGSSPTVLAAGFRLPDTILLENVGRNHNSAASAPSLHQLAHHAGHTLLLLAGPNANAAQFAELHAALQEQTTASPLFERAVCLATETAAEHRLTTDAAKLLGVDAITLLVLRPDNYIGLRADADHLAALYRYRALLCAKAPLRA
jgi:2-polyprenyl-6-methoxyphenol hydroxylase-like FAD-dependent oxidoreductase